jgi:hypothetical protein
MSDMFFVIGFILFFFNKDILTSSQRHFTPFLHRAKSSKEFFLKEEKINQKNLFSETS